MYEVCVCVCVYSSFQYMHTSVCVSHEWVCVCVCVCEREREREYYDNIIVKIDFFSESGMRWTATGALLMIPLRFNGTRTIGISIDSNVPKATQKL